MWESAITMSFKSGSQPNVLLDSNARIRWRNIKSNKLRLAVLECDYRLAVQLAVTYNATIVPVKSFSDDHAQHAHYRAQCCNCLISKQCMPQHNPWLAERFFVAPIRLTRWISRVGGDYAARVHAQWTIIQGLWHTLYTWNSDECRHRDHGMIKKLLISVIVPSWNMILPCTAIFNFLLPGKSWYSWYSAAFPLFVASP